MGPAKIEQIVGKEFLPDLELIDRVIDHLALDKEASILDVGTGWGVMALSLAGHGYQVVTGEPEESHPVDHREENCDHADYEEGYGDWRDRAEALGVSRRIRYQTLNAEALPFSTESFDGVFVYDALQHIEDQSTAVGECVRVTRPNGVLCVIETNARGVTHYRETEHFEIERVDPREFLEGVDIAVEVVPGEVSDAFLIRKT